MRGRFLIPPAMRPGHKYRDTSGVKNMKDIGSGFKENMKKNYNLKEPLFMKDDREGRNINNLWTGYRLGGKGRALMTGSLLGGGAIIAANPERYQDAYNNGANIQYQSENLDIESLPSTRGDAQGYQAPVDHLEGLTSSGDLVFAMHKTRHSGQF